MNPTTKACNEVRHGFNVASGGTKIHNAKAQCILPSHHSVRNECLPALFYGFQQLPIQFVQIFRRLFRPHVCAKFPRNVTQRGDAEVVRDCLQLGVVHCQVVQVPRQSDIILNHLAVSSSSRLLKGEPDFECAKSPRVLRADVVVVQALTLEAVVWRMV